MKARSSTYLNDNGGIVLSVKLDGLYDIVTSLSVIEAHHILMFEARNISGQIILGDNSSFLYVPEDQGEPLVEYRAQNMSVILRGEDLQGLMRALDKAMLNTLSLLEKERRP